MAEAMVAELEAADPDEEIPPQTEMVPPSTRPLVSNVVQGEAILANGEKRRLLVARTPQEITTDIVAAMHGYPKRVGDHLFVLAEGDEPKIRILEDTDALFAEIKHHADVRWGGGKNVVNMNMDTVTPMSRNELFSYMCGPAIIDSYDAVEAWPHEPLLPGAFYLRQDLPSPPSEGEPSPLNELLSALNAETDEDRSLLLAMMCTLVWGGTPGSRPAFILTSEHGRGSGKTTTAEALSHIVGGHLLLNPEDREDRLLGRLVSSEADNVRVILFDNLKKRLSSAIIESVITSDTIQGHRLYHGQFTRPNSFVTIFTANTPQLSTDLAQRGVQIKIGRPAYAGDFRSWAFGHIAQHRSTIIAELMAILRKPVVEPILPANRSRWAGWMDGVLSRMPGANGLARLINNRRGEFDADADDAAEIAAAIRQCLEEHHHNPETVKAFIPGTTMAALVRRAELVEASATKRKATTFLKEHAGSGELGPLRYVTHGAARTRGWLWTGPRAEADSAVIEIPVEGFLG